MQLFIFILCLLFFSLSCYYTRSPKSEDKIKKKFQMQLLYKANQGLYKKTVVWIVNHIKEMFMCEDLGVFVSCVGRRGDESTRSRAATAGAATAV